MKRNLVTLCAATLLVGMGVLGFAYDASADTYTVTWVGGASGDWSVASNWSGLPQGWFPNVGPDNYITIGGTAST